MTEREKIAQIIAEHLCPQGKAHARLYGEERMCYSRDNFAECEKVSECVDALIEAGIGDARKANAEATVYAKIIHKQDCEIKELREKLIEKEKASENAEKASLKTIKECDKKVAKIAHRAEIAERALKDMCEEYEDNFECDLYKECNSDKPCYLCDYKVRLQKAAREIEEGKGK